jgi:hypothetical protein
VSFAFGVKWSKNKSIPLELLDPECEDTAVNIDTNFPFGILGDLTLHSCCNLVN